MTAARRALAHALELGSDLAQREIRIGEGYPGDERHQAILRRPAGRPLDQFRRRQALAHEAAHRAAQPLDGPPADPCG